MVDIEEVFTFSLLIFKLVLTFKLPNHRIHIVYKIHLFCYIIADHQHFHLFAIRIISNTVLTLEREYHYLVSSQISLLMSYHGDY